MMTLVAFSVPLVYDLILIALFTYLLVRGFTQLFIGLFTLGAVLQFAQTLAYVLFNHLPGGFNAHRQYLPILTVVGLCGTLVFLAGFIALAAYLLRAPKKVG